MENRPHLLDLRADSHSSAASVMSKPLRSPRMHIAGEAPPELSPLDAFALQSRLLARQLQECDKDGNRMSRLPPLTIESPLVLQGRSDYFRSLSAESSMDDFESPEISSRPGLQTEIEDAFTNDQRPRSLHPRVSRVSPSPDADGAPAMPGVFPNELRGRQMDDAAQDRTDYGARHERSPSPIQSDTQSQYGEKPSEASPFRQTKKYRTDLHWQGASSTASPERPRQESFDELGLVPPPSLFAKRPPSVLSSVVPEDDETCSNMGGSSQSYPRKLSTGSAALANAMPSPALSSSFRRSLSTASDSSFLPRPSFNFSRPISRAGTPGLDIPARQASSDSQPSFILADDTAHTPVSMHSEAFMDQQADDGKPVASSYIYSKFSLPRGKSLQRSESHDNNSVASTQSEHPTASARNQTSRYPLGAAPPSPPTRPSSSSARNVPDDVISLLSGGMTRPSVDGGSTSVDGPRLGATATGYPSPNPLRPSIEMTGQSEEWPRGRSRTSVPHESQRGRTPASTTTSDSASTIRPPPTARSLVPTAAEMSAEEHLAKGIKCHENGSLKESTYHLRLAARQNNPTAMLLYALACRHGWGMRPNQREGVEWLRKAAEHASIEIAGDEDLEKEGRAPPADVVERRARKAQFALSIYELGVSHMNGWGIEQDKALALRCFEIAGNWGDVDALAEAGFCYAQGVGCKKNLKKSAGFYRMAEAKGMSMVGNSWIHKAKYNDTEKASATEKGKKKARSKSRTRTMFGLKS
ncbi:hypothetical protein E4U43_001087 [Claviceps pusilla]|uniref:Uncharacterized protein n=1 Tax=Claviceps pusilla TaxID=123648 RepID=A0A9P7N949_9HYPO|nr:hypothetical protein E4U43_001087 [Claviceps pusilla]